MIDKEKLMQIAQSNPKIQQGVDEMERRLATLQVTPELLDNIIHVLEIAISHPDQYPKLRQMAIEQGFADAQSIPPQFDQTYVLSMLVAFYELKARADVPHQGFARGGLARSARSLQRMGRGGDTMLAHINPREAAVLKQMGGAGTVNPNTGLTEFKGGSGSILSAVLPMIVNYIAPGLGDSIGTAMGASGATAGMIGNAVIGGVSSAATGGNALQGAALGGLNAGAGTWAGGAANSALGLGLGEAGQAALGSGLIGGLAGAATGQGFGKGALSGAAGQYLGSQLNGVGGTGAMGQGVTEAGRSFGNMMASGYDPKTSAIGGGLAGLAKGMMSGNAAQQPSPSKTVVDGLKASSPVDYSLGTSGTGQQGGLSALSQAQTDSLSSPTSTTSKGILGGLTSNQLMGGAALLSSLGSASQPVQQAVASMSPAQQEYFNRPLVTWDWTKMQQDAAASGQDLSSYLSQNWNKVTAGQYNSPTTKLARGGALNALALGGRSDTIDAKLSPNEYVMDAETIALLGNGSPDSGAKKMDQMRAAIRAHKGKALAAGKISPNAKSPLAYMKGVA
jgi:hypothetical protein